jgi:hypothetical protein
LRFPCGSIFLPLWAEMLPFSFQPASPARAKSLISLRARTLRFPRFQKYQGVDRCFTSLCEFVAANSACSSAKRIGAKQLYVNVFIQSMYFYINHPSDDTRESDGTSTFAACSSSGQGAPMALSRPARTPVRLALAQRHVLIRQSDALSQHVTSSVRENGP